jgi:hypothetical protein
MKMKILISVVMIVALVAAMGSPSAFADINTWLTNGRKAELLFVF